MSADPSTRQTSILFVCLGNICRSPTAQGVFDKKLADSPLADQVVTDSAGTGDWHIGRAPDPRTQQAALKQGYALDHLRARQVTPDDFHQFDWILAMDGSNLADLKAMKPAHCRARVTLFLEPLTEISETEVPDPYYGGEDGFAHVLELCEAASDAWLRRLQSSHKQDA